MRGADELKAGETVMTTRVYRLDPWTGRRELWKEIPPLNPRSGGAISTIVFSADGKTCVYTHLRYSTELVLVEGLSRYGAAARRSPGAPLPKRGCRRNTPR